MATLHLVVVGGAAMVLGYNARQATHDIDALFLPPPEARNVRAWAAIIAREYGWPDDWLNDAAKGYLTGLSHGPVLLAAPGIEVRQPASEQLLAMKLCAWRDDEILLTRVACSRILSPPVTALNSGSTWYPICYPVAN